LSDGGTSDFVPIADDLVMSVSGNVVTKEGSFGMCDGLRVSYTMDLYVNLAKLSDYGVRNFVAEAPTPECGPG